MRPGNCGSLSDAPTAACGNGCRYGSCAPAGRVYVRTWYRRDTGWFGHALRSQRARIRVPGLEADVTIVDIGDTSTQVTTDVDAAYRAKYGPGGAGDPHPCRLRRVASRTGVGDNGGMPEPRRVAVR